MAGRRLAGPAGCAAALDTSLVLVDGRLGRARANPPGGAAPQTTPAARRGNVGPVLASSFTVGDVLTRARFEPATAVGILLAGWWYLSSSRRLAAKGRRWPTGRLVWFMAGLVVLAVASQSGIGGSDTTSFSAHVIEHLLLGMLAPLLLALGAPVTLGLQASNRRTRRTLLQILHSRPVSALTHPVTAWALFGGSLFALYFTTLYRDTLHNVPLHDLVHLHFVAVGCLFFWPLVGIDPIPHRLPHPARLLVVLVALPVHTILGVALITQQRLIAPGITLADQQAGAGILWSAGEAMGLVAIFVIVYQWMSAEEREAIRLDRQLDRQIDVPAAPG
jgi:putative copper resistance protein D